ncbi:MAG TPA: methylenetetrahydrofolate reductase [NAD(P)H] [Treponema sp.]|nr:methylenetetrahydrofolate reductase [NAD(P)H] [Treponema sp.]
MKIINQFVSGRPNLSFEIYPPKHDSRLSDITATLDILAGLKPDFISVTFGAGGSSNNNKTIELSRRIKDEYGIEPLVHLTCLCYSKSEIDDFLNQLDANGLTNILALRGDKREGVPEKNDFLHASDLIAYIRRTQGTKFCIAGACYPECHPQSPDRISDIRAIVKKKEAGAELLISQLFFENDMFTSFVENCRIAGIDVPVCAGIMPVINRNQIEKMVTLCGASLPERFKKIINKYDGNRDALFDAGLSYAVSQIIDLCANGFEYIHLYTMNNPAVAKRIAEGVRNIIR